MRPLLPRHEANPSVQLEPSPQVVLMHLKIPNNSLTINYFFVHLTVVLLEGKEDSFVVNHVKFR